MSVFSGISALSPTSSGPSGRDFFDLVKAIGESKSKQEEDRIVAEEVTYLKKAFTSNSASKKKAKELVIRSLYVEMLGQDASFAYLKVVELCASSNLVFKKAGYLAASLTLRPDHEFRLMLVNRMQQDMKSANQVEACIALSGVCKLVTEDMVPAVLGDVLKLLTHEMENVRKKAVCALHRLYQLEPTCMLDHSGKVNVALCDKDPAVMAATLPLILELSIGNVSEWRSLVPHLVSILKQIVEHRLPKDFDYHRIPAPWVQMSILRILAVLGRGDQSSSEGMYEVLIDVIKRADTGINVGYAIVYECVTTITTIYPNATLLDAAATSISRFIRSDSHNLKYIGIKGLAAIAKDHPKYVADHQMAVIDCLEDPDETLKRKTLSLLYRMTNGINVEFVVEKLLGFLAATKDEHFRVDLVEKVTLCAERYAPSNAWFVRTVISVFESGGDKVKRNVANTLVQLIAEGSGEDSDDDENGADGAGSSDDDLRAEAVDDFLRLLGKPKMPSMLLQTMSWVLGEYGYLSRASTPDMIITALCDLANNTDDAQTRAMAVTATMKLVAQSGTCPATATALVAKFLKSRSVNVQQRCVEFQTLLAHSGTMADVLPVDASCEDIEVDKNLPFLDSFVSQALAAGAIPYSPPQFQDDDDDGAAASAPEKRSSLNFTAYEMPATPANLNLGVMGSAGSDGVGMGGAGADAALHPALAVPTGAEGGADGAANTPQNAVAAMLSPVNQNLNAAAVNNAVLSSQSLKIRAGGASAAGPWGRNMTPVVKPSMEMAPKAEEMTTGAGAAGEDGDSPSLSPGAVTDRIDEALGAGADLVGTGGAPAGMDVSPLTAADALSIEPAKSAEQTKKEKMAAALFGGMGGGGGAVGAGRIGRGISSRRRSNNNGASTAEPSGSSSAGGDLLGIQSGAGEVLSTGASAGAGAGGAEMGDLFGGMTLNAPAPAFDVAPAVGMPASSVPPPPIPGSADGMGDGGGLLFDGMDTAPPPPPVPAPAPAGGSLVDALGAGGEPLKPLPIDTPAFGAKWGSLTGESTQNVNCGNVQSLGTLRGAMESCGYFAHVETIEDTSEAIFAATVNSDLSDVLVHVKMNLGNADITVKATSSSQSSSVLGILLASVHF